jgi:exosome complex RNA-binding protein Rrp42 (RNase PH superfamily)
MSGQKIENEVLMSLRKVIATYKEIDSEKISQEEVQSLFALSVQLYFLKRDAGEDFGPFINPSEISATAAMTAAANLLQAVEIEVFELGMWKSLTGA